MSNSSSYSYFQGSSYSDIFAADIADGPYGFVLQYPSTASWAFYPNRQKYLIQDGSRFETKVTYDKLCQKEPWRNLAVLGDGITGICVRGPREVLKSYWRDRFGFRYDNEMVLERSAWADYVNRDKRLNKLLMLFPHDCILPEKHAVNPDNHYEALSKLSMADMGYNCPAYQAYDLTKTALEEIDLPNSYPYLIKVSHGLSGEGTYIIKRVHDIEYCFRQLRNYLEDGTVKDIIVMDFVPNALSNYCVQFYVGRDGVPTLIGATSQLVSDEGVFEGGIIDYANTGMGRFEAEITATAKYLHGMGYFGIVGLDILEDKDGAMHVIDANIRVNGSTPLCIQRHTLLAAGKPLAKYSTSFTMDGTLDEVLVALKPELDRLDFTILSALEKAQRGNIYCEIHGIVAGESLAEMDAIDTKLGPKGLKIAA